MNTTNLPTPYKSEKTGLHMNPAELRSIAKRTPKRQKEQMKPGPCVKYVPTGDEMTKVPV